PGLEPASSQVRPRPDRRRARSGPSREIRTRIEPVLTGEHAGSATMDIGLRPLLALAGAVPLLLVPDGLLRAQEGPPSGLQITPDGKRTRMSKERGRRALGDHAEPGGRYR